MRVAVAIIYNPDNQVLITQRPFHASHGGFWEFPGGKLEAGEQPHEALVREMREELGIEVKRFHELDLVRYEYPDYEVCLHVFGVHAFTGTPSCCEGQLNMRWVAVTDLNYEDFPRANHSVIRKIKDVQFLIDKQLHPKAQVPA